MQDPRSAFVLPVVPRRSSSAPLLARWLALVLLVPAATQADDAAIGSQLYADMCQSCHGVRMVNPGLAADLRKFPPSEPGRFRQTVLKGTPKGMPAWESQLSADDVNALWDYVKSGG